MKKNLVFLACLLLVCALPALAQKKKVRPLNAQMDIPNCVWIDTVQVFADQTEISNIHWIEYCKWLKENAPEKYTAALPDTTVWDKIASGSSKTSSYTANYYDYVGFRFFPVVGITKAQAEEFCKWRSKIVNENFNKKNEKKARGLYKDYDVEVIYRLPTEAEWHAIAQARSKNPHGFEPLTKKQRRLYQANYPRANCKKERVQDGSIDKKDALITEFMFAYTPNEYGIYNAVGNVAEMVQEEGVGKGGSWWHSLEESTIEARQTYTEPTAWLGFRCVATIKLTPKKGTL